MATSAERFTRDIPEGALKYDTRRLGKPLDPSRVNGGLDYDAIRKRDLENKWRQPSKSKIPSQNGYSRNHVGMTKFEPRADHMLLKKQRSSKHWVYDPESNNYTYVGSLYQREKQKRTAK